MSDYKSTLNLPETGFPMRGDLAKREPGMLARGPMMTCTASFVQPKKAKNLHSA
ncbi:Isoleucyl-tRNA synthetase [Enterobacter hormaechei]|nr:Isoleucyl-tRNA synthetase [Enterobacter hormaechei]